MIRAILVRQLPQACLLSEVIEARDIWKSRLFAPLQTGSALRREATVNFECVGYPKSYSRINLAVAPRDTTLATTFGRPRMPGSGSLRHGRAPLPPWNRGWSASRLPDVPVCRWWLVLMCGTAAGIWPCGSRLIQSAVTTGPARLRSREEGCCFSGTRSPTAVGTHPVTSSFTRARFHRGQRPVRVRNAPAARRPPGFPVPGDLGSAHTRGFAFYLAGKDDYEDSLARAHWRR
jgi:hypothetical protein